MPDNMSPVSERPSRRRKRSRHGSSRRAALGKSSRLSVVSEDPPLSLAFLKCATINVKGLMIASSNEA